LGLEDFFAEKGGAGCAFARDIDGSAQHFAGNYQEQRRYGGQGTTVFDESPAPSPLIPGIPDQPTLHHLEPEGPKPI